MAVSFTVSRTKLNTCSLIFVSASATGGSKGPTGAPLKKPNDPRNEGNRVWAGGCARPAREPPAPRPRPQIPCGSAVVVRLESRQRKRHGKRPHNRLCPPPCAQRGA